jgi:hypothetical protein
MGKPDDTNYPWLGGDPTFTYDKNWQLEIGGVKCAIYQADGDGIIERNDESGRTATVRFICKWNERLDFLAGLLGTVDYSSGAITRQSPFSYPVTDGDQELTFWSRLHCTSVSQITGLHWWTDTTGQLIGDPAVPYWGAYVFAIVTAEFATPLYWLEPDDDTPAFDDLMAQQYVISRIKAGGEVFAPPTGSFVWTAGPDQNNPLIDIHAAHMRTRFELSCTRVRMPIVPMNAIVTAIGSVNQNPVTIGGKAFPKGSILFNNVVPEARSDPVESGIVWDVEYIFLCNAPAGNGQNPQGSPDDPLDWNAFLNTKGDWYTIGTSGAMAPPFRYVDWGPGGADDLFGDSIS